MNAGEETFSQHWLTPFRMIASNMRRDIEQYIVAPFLEWRVRRSPQFRQRIVETFLKEFPEFQVSRSISLSVIEAYEIAISEERFHKEQKRSNKDLLSRARRYAEQKWMASFVGGLMTAGGFGFFLSPLATLSFCLGNIGNLIISYSGSLPKNSQSLVVKVAGYGLSALYLLGVGLTGGVFSLSLDLCIRCIASIGALVTADFIPQRRGLLRTLVPASLWLGSGYMVVHALGLTSTFVAHVPWITGAVAACAAALHDRYSRHTRAIAVGGTIPPLLYFNIISGTYLMVVFGLVSALQYGRTMLKYDAPLFDRDGSRLRGLRRLYAYMKTLPSRAAIHQHGVTIGLLERLGLTENQLATVTEKGIHRLSDIPSLDRIPISLLELMARLKEGEVSPLAGCLLVLASSESIKKITETSGKRNSFARMKKILAAGKVVRVSEEDIKNFSRDDADALHMTADVLEYFGSPPFVPVDARHILQAAVREMRRGGAFCPEILYGIQVLRLLREKDEDGSEVRPIRASREKFKVRLRDVAEDVEWYNTFESAFSGVISSYGHSKWVESGRDLRAPLFSTDEEETFGMISPSRFAEIRQNCYGDAEIRLWQKSAKDLFAQSREEYEEAFENMRHLQELRCLRLRGTGRKEKIAEAEAIFARYGDRENPELEKLSPEDEHFLCGQVMTSCAAFFKSRAAEWKIAKDKFGNKTADFGLGGHLPESEEEVRSWYAYAQQRQRVLTRQMEREAKREKRKSHAPRAVADQPSLASMAEGKERPERVRARRRRSWDMRPRVH